MTYNDECLMLDDIRQIKLDTHLNNLMLLYLVQYVNMVLKERSNEELNDFGRNVMANIVSEVFDNIKARIRK